MSFTALLVVSMIGAAADGGGGGVFDQRRNNGRRRESARGSHSRPPQHAAADEAAAGQEQPLRAACRAVHVARGMRSVIVGVWLLWCCRAARQARPAGGGGARHVRVHVWACPATVCVCGLSDEAVRVGVLSSGDALLEAVLQCVVACLFGAVTATRLGRLPWPCASQYRYTVADPRVVGFESSATP